MHYIFKLNQTVGPDVNHDLSDVLKVKNALERLGFFEWPEHGMTEFPDQNMLDGIKRFQLTENLEPDRVVKPDGPTYMRMTERLRERKKFDAVPPTPPVYGESWAEGLTSVADPEEDGYFGDRQAKFNPTAAAQRAREYARHGAAIGGVAGATVPGAVGIPAGAAIGTVLGSVGGLLSAFGNRTGKIGLVDPAVGP
jgi:hypothetical protein